MCDEKKPAPKFPVTDPIPEDFPAPPAPLPGKRGFSLPPTSANPPMPPVKKPKEPK